MTRSAKLEIAIERWVKECKEQGAYMPSLATTLRIWADDLADRFPDDTNGGMRQDQ